MMKSVKELKTGDIFEWQKTKLEFITSFSTFKQNNDAFVICRIPKHKVKRCRHNDETCNNNNCWHCRRLLVIDNDDALLFNVIDNENA